MSRGHSQPRNQPSRRVWGSCKPTEAIEIIDVDAEKVDVVIVDAEESSRQGSRASETTRRNSCPGDVISIDDEDGDIEDTSRNVHTDATGTELFSEYEESESEECLLTSRNGISSLNGFGYARKHQQVGPSGRRFGFFPSEGFDSSETFGSESGSTEYELSASISSDSDSSDCEIMEESSGNIREQWERAALKRKMPDKNQFVSDDQASGSGSSAETVSSAGEESHQKIDIENHTKCYSNPSWEIPSESHVNDLASGKDNLSFDRPAATGLGYSFQKRNVHTTNSDIDATAHTDHKEPEQTSEVSDKTHAINRIPLNDLKSRFQNQACQLNMQHDPKAGDVVFCSLYKDDANTSGVKLFHGKSSFWGKLEPCSEQSLCNREPKEGEGFAPDHTNLSTKEKPSFDEPSLGDIHHSESPLLNFDGESTLNKPAICKTDGDSRPTTSFSSDGGPDDTSQVNGDLICERERYKESDEYKRAMEEEWAARQHQLQIQAEEAQRLKRKKKAETLRLLDMERRQKQRLEEIRESQKKDKETINLKEHLRAGVRKELEIMELRCRDMASLLRGLGIQVEGGPYPSPRKVNAAYRQALLRFHPDRASRSDIRQQVKAEETFKLISRLKEKLLPVM